MTDLDPSARACLERTRASVLNIVIGIALGIAGSGLVLRWRDQAALWRSQELVRRGLLAALALVALTSYMVRRLGTSRSALRHCIQPFRRFQQAHVISALVAALGVPLGLIYGWLIRPRLDAVSPFWVASLALGLLNLPRAVELEDLDDPSPQNAGTLE